MPEHQPIILRLARTFPRADQPGIGLHCFFYSQFITRKTLIVAKFDESAPRSLPSHASLHQVRYTDSGARSEKLRAVELVWVGLSKLYGAARFTASAFRILRRSGCRPSIIHVHSANYLLTGIALKLAFQAPLCLNFGGTELLRARDLPLYRWMFRFLDTGFYVARSMEADLFRFMPEDRCVYTANGIDHATFFHSADTPRGKDIVAIGNLRWQKDYETLIRAFATASAHFPDVRLVIYGEGELRQDLERLRDELGLSTRVVFQGTRSQAELRDALQRCALYVISSKREGFPKALIEAMACGAPVIATDSGECRKVLEGVAPVVPIGDSGALANEITRLLEDPRRRADVSALCVQRSSKYGWDRVCEVVERRYCDMMRNAS